ncbi:MAG: hypothetical protein K2N95_01910 [Lachnospiraceae bacterium]|nr:hypothetical protein [Lachnospiraceae bacterium]
MNFSERKYVNNTALKGHTIIDSILFLAYLLEVLKGSRTIGYFAVFALLTVVPVVAEWLIYVRNPESGAIKHLIGITYGILYLFVIFTTNSLLPFTYVFPMFIVIILYMDSRFNILVGVFASCGNVACIVYYAMTVGYEKSEIPDVEIRIAATILTAVFMIITTLAVTKVNNVKLKQIQDQTDEAGRLMNNILTTSQDMITDITEVTLQMTSLGDSVAKVHDAMQEISTGSTETAESVQIQIQRTEQIQANISSVKNTTAQIEQNVHDTVNKVAIGREQMAVLERQVEQSKSANAEVLEKMQELSTYTSQMNTITETISRITNSTVMLALNASIEAARAGEVGKGFAVVADQISELASQTQTATSNINNLIENINKGLGHVADAVNVVTRSNDANAESTIVVKNTFAEITSGTEDISCRTEELLHIVMDLEHANKDIVENIQTISAITEEISAHANETFHACDENTRMVDSVNGIVENLNNGAKKLQNGHCSRPI